MIKKKRGGGGNPLGICKICKDTENFYFNPTEKEGS